MNRKWALVLMAIGMVFTAGAQKINLGLKAGINLSGNQGNGVSSSLQQGIDAGAFSEISLGKKWGLNPELYFSQRNTNRADDFSRYYVEEGRTNPNNDIKLSYISLPVLLSYKVSGAISVQAGPQFSMIVFEDENLLKTNRDAFKKADFGLTAGTTLSLEKFRIYARYTWGVSDINDIDDRYDWKSRQLQFGVALSLFSWGAKK